MKPSASRLTPLACGQLLLACVEAAVAAKPSRLHLV